MHRQVDQSFMAFFRNITLSNLKNLLYKEQILSLPWAENKKGIT